MSKPISELNLNNLCKSPKIAIIGTRGKRKNQLTKTIIQHLNKINNNNNSNLIVSPLDNMINFYNECAFKSVIYDKYNSVNLKKRVNENIRLYTNTTVVLDNCLSYDKVWDDDNNLWELMHDDNVSLIVNVQDSFNISEEFKDQFDYVFLMKYDSNVIKRSLFNKYANFLPTFNTFKIVFTFLTDDYSCMIIDNTSITKKGTSMVIDNIWDRVFRYNIDVNTENTLNEPTPETFTQVPQSNQWSLTNCIRTWFN